MKLQVITAKLTDKKIFELFKIRMPIHILFVETETNEINHDYTIKIHDRENKDQKNYPVIKRGEMLLADDYNRLITVIDMHVREGYSYQFLADQKDITDKKPLLELLDNIDKEVIETCVYLDYDAKEKFFEIRYPKLANKNSDVLYFFPVDKSILQFSDAGPELFLSPNVNNISDILIE